MPFTRSLILPPTFFRLEIVNNVHYGSDPSKGGKIRLNRLVKGDPAWETNTSGYQLKEKLLFLCVPQAVGWSDVKISVIQEILQALLNKKFIIFVHQYCQDFILLNRDNLYCFSERSIRNNMCFPEGPNVLKAQIAEEFHLAYSAFILLDDHELHCLMHPNLRIGPRQVFYSEIFSALAQLQDKFITCPLVKWLRTPPGQPILLVNDERIDKYFLTNSDHLLNRFKNTFNLYGVIISENKFLVLAPELISNPAFLVNISQAHALTFEEFQPAVLNSYLLQALCIESLKLHNIESADNDEIEDLSRLKQLRELSIRNPDSTFPGIAGHNDLSITGLKLTLPTINTAIDFLNILVPRTPGLTYLSLSIVNKTIVSSQRPSFNWPPLVSLSITSTLSSMLFNPIPEVLSHSVRVLTLYPSTIENLSLLNQFHNLYSLTLDCDGYCVQMSVLQKIKLPDSLSILVLTGSCNTKFSSQSTLELLEASPNLHSLILCSQAKKLYDQKTWECALFTFLLGANQLQNFDFPSNRLSSKDDFFLLLDQPLPLNFKNLQKLRLTFQGNLFNLYRALQEASKTLRQLILQLTEIDSFSQPEGLVITPLDFPNLQHLDITLNNTRSIFNSKAFEYFSAQLFFHLSHSPLHYLSLSGDKYYYRLDLKLLTAKASALTRLTTLHLDGCILEEQGLIALIHYSAASLKYLSLGLNVIKASSQTGLSQAFWKKSFPSLQLQDCTIYGTKISNIFLEHLLRRCAESLITLNLSLFDYLLTLNLQGLQFSSLIRLDIYFNGKRSYALLKAFVQATAAAIFKKLVISGEDIQLKEFVATNLAACIEALKKDEPIALESRAEARDSAQSTLFGPSSHQQTPSQHPFGHQKTKGFSGITTHEPQTFLLENFFDPLTVNAQPIHPILYRCEAYESVTINAQAKSLADPVFLLSNPSPFSAEHCVAVEIEGLDPEAFFQQTEEARLLDDDQERHLGTRPAFVVGPEWRAIPSLKPSEKILAYCKHKEIPELEFIYYPPHHLHYMRLKDLTLIARSIPFTFIVQFVKTLPPGLLPRAWLVAQQYLSTFQAGELVLEANTNPLGLVKAMLAQKKGSCAHRAALFFWKFHNKDHPFTMILNEAHHAFIEVPDSNRNYRLLNLGGYPNHHRLQFPKGYAYTQQWIRSNLQLNQLLQQAVEVPKIELPKPLSFEAYGEQLLAGPLSCLILTEAGLKQSMPIALQKLYPQHCYRIPTAEDLSCPLYHLKKIPGEDGSITGILTEGPSGALYQFLTGNAAEAKLLLLDLDIFTSLSDRQRLQDVLTHRTLDGFSLPQTLRIVGVTDHLPADEEQTDAPFAPLPFARQEKCPFTLAELQATCPLPQAKLSVSQATFDPQAPDADYCLDLNDAPDWQSYLVGEWILKEGQFHWKPGALQALFAKHPCGEPLTLELRNAPWDDAMERFWQEATIWGFIDCQEIRIILPKQLTIIRTHGYRWAELAQKISRVEQLSPDALLLNHSNFYEYFPHAHLDATGAIDYTEGLLADACDQTLQIQVMATLSDGQWAKLLQTAAIHQVNLQVYYEAKVELPQPLQAQWASEVSRCYSQPFTVSFLSRLATILLHSNDSGLVLYHLLEPKTSFDVVIDVSGLAVSDLWTHYEPRVDDRFCFTAKDGALLTALKAGQSVLLTGSFAALQDDFFAFLKQRASEKEPCGRLTLLLNSDEAVLFPNFFMEEHCITLEEKKRSLGEQGYQPEEWEKVHDFQGESWYRLKARLDYLRLYPQALNHQNPWDALARRTNPELAQMQMQPHYDLQNAAAVALQFEQDFAQTIQDHWKQDRKVLLIGPTGVGKTAGVRKLYANDSNQYAWYEGPGSMTAWAEDRSTRADGSPKPKILFWDELNLSASEQLKQLSLLNTQRPGLVIEGCYYALTLDHYFIGAGNPVAYGQRYSGNVFEEQGNIISCVPFPVEFIAEVILKPFFSDYPLDQAHQLMQPFLSIYAFLCARSQHRVLISVRELEMMALLTVSNLQKQAADQPNAFRTEAALNLAKHFAYQVAVGLVPAKDRGRFDQQFNAFKQSTPFVCQKLSEERYLLPSMQAAYDQVQQCFALMDWRESLSARSQADQMMADDPFAEVKQYGGLGGLLLEEEPGTNAAEFIQFLLFRQGYQSYPLVADQRTSEENAPKEDGQRYFYFLPASMSQEQQKHWLLIAFDRGAPVVMEHLSRTPPPEAWLNAFLMGRHPETGERPNKPGFFLFASLENARSQKILQPLSIALLHRFLQGRLPNTTQQDITVLLSQQAHLLDWQATLLAQSYWERKSSVQQSNVVAQPTLNYSPLFQAAELLRANSSEQTQSASRKHPHAEDSDEESYVTSDEDSDSADTEQNAAAEAKRLSL